MPLALDPGGGPARRATSRSRCCTGPFGEDGTVQGLLELLDVPYVGAGVLASSLCMDKVVFKDVLAAAGVPQVGYAACARRAGAPRPTPSARSSRALGLPLFVKPARLGSSVGIAKVRERGRAGRRRSSGAFAHDGARDRRGVQRRHRGRVRGDRAARGRGVRAGRGRPARGAEWYDYEAKYSDGGVELQRARADPRRRGRDGPPRWRVETFLRVGCAGLARVDFFVEDDGRVLVNELNTLPGMTPTSAFPKLWEATRRAVAAGRATACWRSRSSATPPSARPRAF